LPTGIPLQTNTRVDFYILEADDPASRMRFACRLTEKAYGLKNSVYAHTSSQADAQKLDELLWTFRQGSFVPHSILDEDTDEFSPVKIGIPEKSLTSGELLINLSGAAPSFAGNFERVAEIVDASDAARKAGRERFKQYREMGMEPVTHTID
jgi:DNA polymerase-3 subunit chi